eukprot:c21021_g1_i2 orf=472-2415(+)
MQPGYEQGAAYPSVWMQGSSSWMPSVPGADHMGGSALARMDTIDSDGTLHAIINDSVHSVDVPVQNPSFQDHEMFSWLHFPIEDPIDKGLCADLFRDFPSSNVQIVKHSFNQLGLQQEALSLTASEALLGDLLPPNPKISGLSICPSISQGTVEAVESCSSCPNEARNMVAGADAAMVVDGRHVANLYSTHYGAEGFNKMQASLHLPFPVDNSLQAAVPVAKLKNLDMVPLLNPNSSPMDPSQRHLPSSFQESPQLPLLKAIDVPFCTTQPSLQRNFAHFSSPVAETRANLHAVSASSGPTSLERARQQYGQVGQVDCNGIKQLPQRELMARDNESRPVALPLQPSPRASLNGQAGETSRAEQTATSASRGSGSSSEKSGRDAATATKRRFCGADDSEYQSEDLEETTNNSKKPVKRSRAAEMHNLCERKRRDRINEKLMALRDLMPNSSKTAKASILDEAIEYVKLLQSQLQAWSARTGICIPPALIPSMGMQMPAMSHMGLGMGVGMGVGLGMGMGMGMGFMDINAVAAGRTMMPLPPYPAQPSTLPSNAMGGIQLCVPAVSIVDGQEHLQNPQILDPYNVYVPHHQAQPAPMNMAMYRNMELYNAYLQGQQQQQHQWQQLQQQHQWQLLQHQQSKANTASKPAQ